MKKRCAFLFVALVAFVMISGCSGFKGFCDRGSLLPTRQPQVVPMQTMYTVTGDMCCPSEMMMPACDPCGNMGSSVSYPGPVVQYN